MGEKPGPTETDIAIRRAKISFSVNAAMSSHPDKEIASHWRGKLVGESLQGFFVITKSAVMNGVAVALSGDNITDLTRQVQEYIATKKLPNNPRQRKIGQGLIARINNLEENHNNSLNELTNQNDEIAMLLADITPPDEQALWATRTTAARYLTMLEYICNPKIPTVEHDPAKLRNKLQLVSQLSSEAVRLIREKQAAEKPRGYATRATQPKVA